jgi:IclR family KDG regulon transcriptional repressor
MLYNDQLTSTEKVIWLLKRLGEPPYEIGLTDLANEIGHAKSGIYKILSTLMRDGLVYQDHSTKKYCLGPTMQRLGMLYNEPKGILSYAEPIVTEIAHSTMESIYIGMRQGDAVIVVYGKESPHNLRLHTKIGQPCPINAGSIGKLMAAFDSPERIRLMLRQKPLTPKTPNTLIDPEKLLMEYETIRSQGYSISNQENCIGAFGIAAPIRNHNNQIIACLNISGPKDRFTPEKVVEWTRLIIEGANEISARITCRDQNISHRPPKTVRSSQ